MRLAVRDERSKDPDAELFRRRPAGHGERCAFSHPAQKPESTPKNGWGKKVGNPERPEENTSLEETRARALFRERKSPQARGRGEDVVVVVVTPRVFPRVACIVVVVVGTDDEE